jgi:hypothetical protein
MAISIASMTFSCASTGRTESKAPSVKTNSSSQLLSNRPELGGDPIMRNASGNPIMVQGKTTAAGDPIMMTTLKTAGGDPIMMDAKGNRYIINETGDPIMINAKEIPVSQFHNK